MNSNTYNSGQQKRAWLYYTSRNQHEDMPGARYQNLIRFADSLGYKIIGNSMDIDAPGVIRSSGLAEIMKATIQGSFDILIIYSTLMLGRDIEQRNTVITALQSRNIQIYSYEDAMWLT